MGSVKMRRPAICTYDVDWPICGNCNKAKRSQLAILLALSGSGTDPSEAQSRLDLSQD